MFGIRSLFCVRKLPSIRKLVFCSRMQVVLYTHVVLYIMPLACLYFASLCACMLVCSMQAHRVVVVGVGLQSNVNARFARTGR